MNRKKNVTDRLAEIEKRIDADDMIGAKERDEIKERARAHVRKKQIEKLTDKLFAEEVKRAERDYAPLEEQLEEIFVELPEFAYQLVIDGCSYFHGCVYDVPRHRYLSMIDQIARSWEHDREIHGRRRKGDIMRDPFGRGVNQGRDMRMSGSGQVTTTHSIRQSMGR